MIQFTSAAVTELKRLQSRHPHSTPWVRFEVLPGGCADLSYNIIFETEKSTDDRVYSGEGIDAIVHPEQLQYLEGLNVDYADDLMGGGFQFSNPNATKTCQCGQSFSLKEE
ncbi:HesB/IscA family protein [Roseofilum casamattae]|uniref:Iron-sulfur cluster assembly accessory protein n=1 Tax=Roseofilum casamattae BLCC-M143 TaxID=3022442 RepID=A0ABT7BSD6_9CYAN|nr:iron-sulfur cluster assembly accessory protein [Roseofilum casamattae]MDJ1182100.1 iron-sulfur cluster assembly accessory protein [Roseofilum casamattae BLCC-M143]